MKHAIQCKIVGWSMKWYAGDDKPTRTITLTTPNDPPITLAVSARMLDSITDMESPISCTLTLEIL